MDKLLQLKLEMVYRDMPIEQVQQRFEELKGTAPKEVPKKRKLKIPAK